MKTVHHSARPRFRNNIYNDTSMFNVYHLVNKLHNFYLCTSQTYYCDCVSVSEVQMRKALLLQQDTEGRGQTKTRTGAPAGGQGGALAPPGN